MAHPLWGISWYSMYRFVISYHSTVVMSVLCRGVPQWRPPPEMLNFLSRKVTNYLEVCTIPDKKIWLYYRILR